MTEMLDYNSAPRSLRFRAWSTMAPILLAHIVMCCVSLIYVAEIMPYQNTVFFDKVHAPGAILNVSLFALVAIIFLLSRFSFGYVIGFNFFTLIVGYIWLIEFSRRHYSHSLALTSIAVSALAFLLPALLITSPIRQRMILSTRAFDFLLYFILILAATIDAIGATHNFRLVWILDVYNFRGELLFPKWMGYAFGIISGALLPFCFACFWMQGKRWGAAIALLLLVLLYPITLSKTTLLAPGLLIFLTLLTQLFEARTSAVLSLTLPISLGVAAVAAAKLDLIPFNQITTYFGLINTRMVAFPSIALDIYNDFFSSHSLTHFCQISFLKPFMACPYSQPIPSVMEEAYHLGSFNASLFATEGIASVGTWLAPLSALACGLVIALGNRLSSGLPPTFVLLSGGVLPQAFLNVPLSTTLLTHGASVLFLLWYVTPRSAFQPRNACRLDRDQINPTDGSHRAAQ